MLRVALTGGIATGKTYVLERLRACGVPVIDADDLVHGALLSGTPATAAVSQQFGQHMLDADGAVNRQALGTRVFSDASARRTLEAILHPAVYAAIQQWFEDLKSSGALLGVAAIPLLYETNHEEDFQAVVVTACSPETQIRRVTERDRLSEAEARRRIAAQLPIEEKLNRADFVIRTDGPLAETDRQVDETLVKLRSRAEKE